MHATGNASIARERRLFFTVTTGRSGTEYLAQCLALFSAVEARHEPRPRFSTAFRAVVTAPGVAREFWEREKLPKIARGSSAIYAETSHFFCKGFADSLVDLGHVPELIHLRRAPRATARSLWQLESIPGRSLRGVRYYLSPWDANHLPVDAELARGWNDYQLCFWYCLEIEARARVLRERLEPRGVRFHEVELGAIRSVDGIQELGSRLELGPLSLFGRMRIAARARRQANVKQELKRADALPEAELDGWESAVREACGLAAAPRG